jgi:hypothetical protein
VFEKGTRLSDLVKGCKRIKWSSPIIRIV